MSVETHGAAAETTTSVDDPGILDLPNEILHDIVVEVMKTDQAQNITWIPLSRLLQYQTLLALSLSCRRLYHIVEPVLYNNIFGFGYYRQTSYGKFLPSSADPNFGVLSRTLRESSKLPPLCKQLEIYINHMGSYGGADDETQQAQEWNGFKDIVSLLYNVRRLEFVYPPVTWPTLKFVAESMPLIEKLTLNGDKCSTIDRLVHELDFPNLHTLVLKRLAVTGGKEYGSRIRRLPPGTVITPAEKRRTSPIKVLEGIVFECHPADFKELLEWPTALEELSLVDFPWFYEAGELYTAPVLSALFSMHKRSLRRIRFSRLLQRLTQPDLGDYPLLERIYMHWPNLPASPEEAVRRLCGPSLSSLTISFDYEDQQGQVWFKFDRDAYDYLLQFVTCARHQKSSLRYLNIIFGTGMEGTTYEQVHRIKWSHDTLEQRLNSVKKIYEPWDLMERLKENLAPLGVEFKYSGPDFTKQQAIDYVTILTKEEVMNLSDEMLRWRLERQALGYE